jgi:hypothetical protein
LVSEPPLFEVVSPTNPFIGPAITPNTIEVQVAPYFVGEEITYYLYDNTGNNLIEEVTIQQSTYEFTGLTAGTTYQIAARNEAGCFANQITLTTLS